MDKQYFPNTGIHQMPIWQSLASPPELNCSPEPQPSNFFHKPNWEKSTDQCSSDSLAIRELIGKLGTICSSGDISTDAGALYMGAGNNSANTSCYNTPLNSPSKLHIPIMDHFLDENLPNLRNSIPLSPNLPAISTDTGFAERAAKFSCFGNRSFDGRTSQFELKNTEFQPISNNPFNGIGKLPRISSNPSIKLAGSSLGLQENKNSTPIQMELNSDKKLSRLSASAANSNEDSSVSEQIPSGEKTPTDINSRKRKAISKGKLKETPTKEEEANDDSNSKRSKETEIKANGNGNVKTEEEAKAEEKEGPKPPEPPKDYIHVRARRGQATDSHSLAERVRREKISERMKLLQDLVPGCNKVTGKAPMLDEIINYVQSLQRQVEFLSMKLASVNPRIDVNMDTPLPKDIFQQNGNLHHPNFPIDSTFYGHHQHTDISSGSMGPLDATICHNLGLQSPQANGFAEALPQFATFFEDDLQSIVQMGFGDNLNYPATNPKSQKVEL